MPDQLLIGWIRQDEAMFRAVKQCRETRRLEEHLLQSTNLHVGSTESSLLASVICPIYREACYLLASITCREFEPVDLDKITMPKWD